jgi:hypothetical protein
VTNQEQFLWAVQMMVLANSVNVTTQPGFNETKLISFLSRAFPTPSGRRLPHAKRYRLTFRLPPLRWNSAVGCLKTFVATTTKCLVGFTAANPGKS